VSPGNPARPVRFVALGILIRVERDRSHAAPLLDSKGAHLDSRDRDLLRALVKKTLRNAIRLDHVLDRYTTRPMANLDPEIRAALRLGATQLLLMDRIPPHAAVGETVTAVKEFMPHAAGMVNAVLRRLAREEKPPGAVLLPSGTDPVKRLAIETSHPEWLVRRWVKELGEEATRVALWADENDSPIDLLMDPRAGALEEVVAALTRDGVTTVASEWAPLARTVTSGDAIGHPLVASGALGIVDVAAQSMVELVSPAPIVIDLGAAPGGKTRTLLARGLAARVLSLELHPTRSERLRRNLRAAGRLGEAAVVRADIRRAPLARGAFPSVLLDAPCSGTGTLRKNPEIRSRLTLADLASFASVQAELLHAAIDLLAPEGTVTYVTCSLEPEENENVVDRVLGEREDSVRVRDLPDTTPAPLRNCSRSDGLVRVPPGPTHDGFSSITIRRMRQDR
jgi:16S rRNA (cytosine967-C5)-methyltransferase